MKAHKTISIITASVLATMLLILNAAAANADAYSQTSSGSQIENPAVQVYAGRGYSLAVRKDGTVIYAGDLERMQKIIPTWTDVDTVVNGYFARKKDGSYISLYGPTNLPVQDSPIAISMAMAGNWAALLPNGMLLYSPNEEQINQFDHEDFDGYGMPMEGVRQVVFGSASYYSLMQDGTVIPHCMTGREEIAAWTGIKSLCFCNGYLPIALTDDGRVLAPSSCKDIETSAWTDVVKVLANSSLTVGLRSDGTVLATGGEYGTEPFADDISRWTGITDIAVSDNTMFNGEDAFAVGLKGDGTVTFAGDLAKPSIAKLQNTITGWTDIKQISAGANHVLGLKSDGTVVAAGDNSYGQCNIEIKKASATDRFSEIIQPLPDIACGLRTDGTVAVMEMRQDASSAGNAERSAFKDTVEKWSDVNKIAVLGNMNGIAGIKNDGSVLIEVILEDYMDDLEKDYKECQEWKDIADIVSNSFGTFGLKTDGTVTATSGTIRYFEENYQRKFTFDTWKDIKEIHLSTNMNGDYLLLGLSGDGTLYYNGASYFAKDWNGVRNIAAVDIGAYVYLLLREDGTVDASGINCGEWTGTVYKWKEIIQTIAGESAAAGLNSDGTVVVAGTGYPENLKWDDVSKLYFDADDNLYGVCKNGTVKICLRSDAYQYYKADRESVKTWNDIEKLSFLYDIENQEMTIVGIRKDGSIVNTEEVLNESIKSNAVDTQSYSDIIQTFDGDAICALRLDGTVKVVELLPGDKDNDAEFGRFKENVEKWTDIKKIVRIGGLGGIAGIKENGDVVLELMDDDYFERMHGECREWHGIEDIISGDSGTFGLKKDGTVIATEATIRLRENTSSSNYIFDTWKDIVTIKGPEYCLGGFGFFGLSRDGVLYHDGFSILNDWNGLKNIADIEGTTSMFLALRKDGTVYPDRNMSDWKDIIQIKAGGTHAAGITGDGSVLVTDHSIDNQTVILDWPEVISIYFGYFGLNDTLFGVCKDGTIRYYVPEISDDLTPYVNQDEINTWTGIVKLSLVYDHYKKRYDEQSEIIVIGYREDGSIVSTRDLSL